MTKQRHKPLGNAPSHLVELVEYTDPYCTWCWGSEPILRKIKEVYGDQVEISFKMGGLVEDVGSFDDPVNMIGGERIFEHVADHWLDAARKHGMPVDSKVWHDLAKEFRSTYPANIAYKAAQMQSRELADKFLRRLREAAAAESRLIHKREVQIELAEEVGLDPERFAEDLDNGNAGKAFREDVKECGRMGVTGFPTFLLRNLASGKTVLANGYRGFEYYERVLDELTHGTLTKKPIKVSDEEVVDFINRWAKSATQEVATVFNLKKQDALNLLRKLEARGFLRGIKAGNDYFWSTTHKTL